MTADARVGHELDLQGRGIAEASRMPRRKQSNGSPDIGQLVLHYIRAKPRATTLAELLADPLIGPIVPTLTLAMFGGEIPVGGEKRRGSKQVAAAPVKRGRNGGANTRTADGRNAYDANVLAAIRSAGGPASAEQLLQKTGGDAAQFRAATKRLASAKKIKRSGKARGTKYAAV